MRIPLPCRYYEEMLFEKLVNVVKRSRCKCIALSGGIDTSAILLASIKAGSKPRAFTAIYSEGIPKDLPYVIYLSKLFNIDLEVVSLSYKDAVSIRDDIVNCIGSRELDSHRDGGCIEFRNDVVFYTVLKSAKEFGCNCIYVGSGADELLLGYSFLLTLYGEALEDTIKRFIHGRYPELRIGSCLNVETVAPFLEEEIIDFILEIPLNCLRSERMLGKEVIRYMLDFHGLDAIAWRRKTPAEEGAGTKSLCVSIYDY
jgi:asparagine synthase (glutamine-hydrolysing)